MAEASEVGLNFAIRADPEIINNLTAALKELTTTVANLNQILSGQVSATQAVNTVLQQNADVTQKAANTSNEINAVINSERSGWVNLAESVLQETKSSEDAISVLVNLGARKKEAIAIVDGLTASLRQEAVAQKEVVNATSTTGATGGAMQDMAYWKAQADAKNAEAEARQRNAQSANVESVSVEQNTNAEKQNTIAIEQETDSLRKANTAKEQAAGGFHNMWQQSFLFFGAAMMVNSAIQQVAASQEEKANPAMMQFGRAMQEVSSGAMIGIMIPGAGAAGMAIGALAGVLLAFGITSLTVAPEVAALNKQLDTLAKKDDVIQALSDIAKVSYAEAEAMMASAKASPEAAKALQQYVDATQQMSGTQRLLNTVALGYQDLATSILGTTKAQTDLTAAVRAGLAEYHLEFIVDAVAKYDELRQVQGEMAKAAFDAVAPTASLNAELENITKKGDAVDVLSKLSGLTKEQATNAMEAAKNNADVATQLQDAKTSYDQATIAVEKLKVAQAEGVDVTDKLTQAEQAQAVALQSIKNIAGNLANVYYELGQAQNDAAQAADNLNQSIMKSAADAAATQIDAQKKVADAARQTAEQIARDNRSLADRLSDIGFQRIQDGLRTNEQIEKDFRSLSDKEADIQRGLLDKNTDAYHSYQKSIESINDDIAKKAQELADKILEINKKEIEDLQNLDYDTATRLQSAKSENERMAIEADAMHKRALIRQNADDQRDSAYQSVAEAQKDSEKKKQIALDEYNYRKSINQREANEQRADAERAYQEQVSDAQRQLAVQEAALDRQIYEAKRSNAEQIADSRSKLSQDIQDTVTAALDKAKVWRNETIALAAEYANRLSLASQYASAINQMSQGSVTSGAMGVNLLRGFEGVQLGGAGGGGSSGFGTDRNQTSNITNNNSGGNKATINVYHNDVSYIVEALKQYLMQNGIGQVSQ